MKVQPLDIRRTDDGIIIDWSDGRQIEYAASELRSACPCATCREKRTGEEEKAQPLALPVLSVAEAQPVTIKHMQPVGNYAYSIVFSDDHDTGIFTFEFLRQVASDATSG